MDWFGGKVSLGSLDLAGAVNKLQESVKNIEKNFDSALGLEDKPRSSNEGSASWSSTNTKALFDPVMSFMGHKSEEDVAESKDSKSPWKSPQDEVGSAGNRDELPEEKETTQDPSLLERQKDDQTDEAVIPASELTLPSEGSAELKEQNERVDAEALEEAHAMAEDSGKVMSDAHMPSGSPESTVLDVGPLASSEHLVEEENLKNTRATKEPNVEKSSPLQEQVTSDNHAGNDIEHLKAGEASSVVEPRSPTVSADSRSLTDLPSDKVPEMVSDQATKESDANPESVEVSKRSNEDEVGAKELRLSSASNVSDSADAVVELEKVKGNENDGSCIARSCPTSSSQSSEIAKLMTENEQLKSVVDDLRRKSSDADIESLREEYHQRVATLERKVYALTKERDTLRREQSKRSDAAALLREKDEIINQVMAEGEQLSKKQAAQEAQIRKLRAQVRELEEEKKAFVTKLQLEESKVESIKKDKAATEQLLQETIEKHQTELSGQKEYYTKALNAAKEAEALAEARANSEARTQLEGHLKEAEVREAMLVQALEELRQTLSRQEQQAIDKEDMLRREIEDLQKRYQASERRCEELVTQLPESTRPLLRQIEAMQETSARKAEAWAAVERTLQSRLQVSNLSINSVYPSLEARTSVLRVVVVVQEAEAKAAAAEEKERSINERLSQTLSRVNVLEAQISCLRAEQTQLNRSLEKERQRAAENRQEYLAAKEEADTHEARVNQLEEEIRELKRKHKNELQESLTHRELLQQEIEREKAARLELEKTAHLQSSASDQSPTRDKLALENGKLMRKLSSTSSVGNMEESFFLQASLDSGNFLERRNSGESTMNPYYLKSMTPSAFEAALRQKEGELASYMSRLASMESIRDSLAEELVKMTEQCEKLRTEAAMLPGIRAELEALRQRHTAALELMGERDEEFLFFWVAITLRSLGAMVLKDQPYWFVLEELRNDIVDLKEMYREQIQMLSSQIGAA
ncbi:hypothetical protein Cgig2_020509 [Carnegiea gigantea]|uniref:TATA element modulatory factor 1 TATA binding domain-containing protein n=1 Tax=Carnegiea gigantea TaxID=171969 RepID=A0A9Q1K9P4_9CARY|nr:hypothetical protein Cgig2_020509 [Carnegiea gigantea]